jgi:7-cyano-7-deazaguanine reductase
MTNLKYGEQAIQEAKLETWENPFPDRDYLIEITFPEFTCLCPRSGYPDFATIKISYIPDKYIVELRSLKLYLNKFRGEYISHENATNKIFNDLFQVLKPRFLEVIGDWNVRGNVKTIVTVSSNSIQNKIEGQK